MRGPVALGFDVARHPPVPRRGTAVGRMLGPFLALSMGLFCSCAAATHGHPVPARLGAGLVRSERLAPSMLLRQRLHGKFGARQFDVDCVLQVVHGKLTIVGLTPFGSRAFVLTQTGLRYEFEQMLAGHLPFDPVRILEDVHRVFFRGLPSSRENLVRGVQAGDRVLERWSGGVLRERTFERIDRNPPGVIRVTYLGPSAPLVPVRVRLDNQRHGYTLDIETVAQQLLPDEAP